MEYKHDQPSIDHDEEEITHEDVWTVISAYFEEKGLICQQFDSFDQFIQNTMQEIIDESSDIEIRSQSQHNPGLPTRRIEEAAEKGELYELVLMIIWNCLDFARREDEKDAIRSLDLLYRRVESSMEEKVQELERNWDVIQEQELKQPSPVER